MAVPYTFATQTGSIPLQELDDNFSACLSGTAAITQGGTGQTTKTNAFDALSPTTTKGDLIVYDGADNIRLPVGTNGQALIADSTVSAGVKWAAAGSGTVTSVDFSGGTTGLTATGAPITSSGTITLGGTLGTANGGTGLTALGTGVTTALGVNINSVGSFITNGGVLGTPASGTLTNATGLPVSTGISGLGTNVATALGVAVGSAGAVVTNGGALGTPSSGIASNITVDGTDAVGFRNVPINSQSAAYTAVIADSGKAILHPSTDANARTFTIPANSSVAYPLGTVLTFINMTSQVVSIAINTDTLYLAGTGTTGTRSLAQYGMASALKLTSTTWLISGNGLT